MVEKGVLCQSCCQDITSQISKAKKGSRKGGSCPCCGQVFHLKWKKRGEVFILSRISFPGLIGGNNCPKKGKKRSEAKARQKNDESAREKKTAKERTMRRDPRGNHIVPLPKK